MNEQTKEYNQEECSASCGLNAHPELASDVCTCGGYERWLNNTQDQTKIQLKEWEKDFDSEFTEIDAEFGNRYIKGSSPMQIKEFIYSLLKSQREDLVKKGENIKIKEATYDEWNEKHLDVYNQAIQDYQDLIKEEI